MEINKAAYIAGLFDGEGSVACKQKPTNRPDPGGKVYNQWYIRCEISMTDKEVISWVHETLEVGTVIRRDVKGLTKTGKKFKTQWRWRCTFRDCYSVCKLLWPHVKVKLNKIEQVIDHYEPEFGPDKNVVNIDEFKMRKEMMWE